MTMMTIDPSMSALVERDVSSAGTCTVRTRDPRAFGEVASTAFSPLRLDCDRPGGFKGRMRSRLQGEVFVAEVRARAHTILQRPTAESSSTPRVKVGLSVAGRMVARQAGREATVLPGDMIALSTEHPYDLLLDDDFRALWITFPRSVADVPGADFDQLTATRIAGDDGLAAIVAPMLGRMPDHLDALSSASGHRFINHTVDLLVDTLHERLGTTRETAGDARRAALLAAIHAYIDEHLAEPDLDPAGIAASNYISVRHLHGLFQEQGETVASWIRTRRLERCRRDLADPLARHRTITEIAFGWGFTDPSHFSRLFRTTFGVSPSECRPPR